MFKVISIFVCLLFVFGCSKSPEQSAQEAPAENLKNFKKNIPNLNTSLSIITKPVPGEDQVGGSQNDDFIKENSSKPAFYAKGAAGITFDTTLEESETLLSKPRNPPNADGEAFYDESIYIRWRLTAPRTPAWILLLSGYQGKIVPNPPAEPFGINKDFSSYGTNSLESAQNLARDVYKMFNDVPEDFDCLPKGFCQVNWGNSDKKDFMIITPGALLLLSKDRFVIFRMMITKDIPLGILDSNLDLLNGSFQVEGGAPIEFGQSYEEIEKRLNIETTTTPGAKYYNRSYTGAALVYNRTDFSRDAKEPLPENKLKALAVWSDYKKIFTLDGQAVVVKETEKDVSLELVSKSYFSSGVKVNEFGTQLDPMKMGDVAMDFSKKENAESTEIPLQINLNLKRQNVLSFTEQFTSLLVKQFKKKFPKRTIFSRVSGQFQKKDIKDYSSYVVSYDEETGEGLLVEYGMSEENGIFSSFYVGKFGNEFDPFDSLILPNAVKDVKASEGGKFNSISGFNLGDRVTISDWDLGRGEALLSMGDKQTRVNYAERDVVNIALTTDKTEPVNVASVSVGSLSVGLSLVLVSETEKERVYKVSGILSSIKSARVKGLCGGSINIKYGANEDKFLKKIKENKKCSYLPVFDSGGNGKLTGIYFPTERVRLGFADKQFVSTRVYAQASEVK